MAERIGIRELRDTLTSALRRVRAGATLEVTHDGEPFALITPLPQDRIARLLARPGVTPPRRPLGPFRPRPSTTGISGSDALAEDRGD